MRLDNFRGWELLAVNGKVKAGATPGLAFGTTPPINVSPLGALLFVRVSFAYMLL